MIRPVRPIGPDDLRLRREGADREADEEHGADAEREADDVDLTDQVADADREKRRQDRLAADDVARKIQHLQSLPDSNWMQSAGVAARVAKLPDHPVHQLAASAVAYRACLYSRPIAFHLNSPI